ADAKDFVRLQEIKKNEGAQTFPGGRFDSFRTAVGTTSVRSAKRISRSAERDLRLRLKKSCGSGGFP
ncbi:MAG: hypothetical protein IKK01_00955, partial [Clostridia bacterium]|nr:hypothetical protein [Clostridia bacterium]